MAEPKHTMQTIITQFPVCLWFLAKNKVGDTKRGFRDRRKQALFIDARKLQLN